MALDSGPILHWASRSPPCERCLAQLRGLMQRCMPLLVLAVALLVVSLSGFPQSKLSQLVKPQPAYTTEQEWIVNQIVRGIIDMSRFAERQDVSVAFDLRVRSTAPPTATLLNDATYELTTARAVPHERPPGDCQGARARWAQRHAGGHLRYHARACQPAARRAENRERSRTGHIARCAGMGARAAAARHGRLARARRTSCRHAPREIRVLASRVPPSQLRRVPRRVRRHLATQGRSGNAAGRLAGHSRCGGREPMGGVRLWSPNRRGATCLVALSRRQALG